MTDKEKLEAIRAEIHRLVDVRGYDREMANDLFAFMDSLPNEPKDKCQGCNNVKGCITCVDGSEWAHIEESESDIKAYHDRWGKSNGYIEEPVSEDIQKIGSLKSFEYYPEKKTTNKTDKGVFDANMPRRKAYLRGFKDGAHAHKELLANKPVSKDLEAEIEYLSKRYPEVSFAKLSRIAVHVVNWQKEQLKKDRLKYYDSITEEQYNLEVGFIDSHIDKYNRMPTFLDAIEYGRRIQKEQMVTNATEVTVHIEAGNYPYIPQMELYDYDKDVPLAKEGDKYKVVLIKEE